MMDVPDHPDIRDAEINGVGYDIPDPKCPICGAECETLFVQGGDVLGCEWCIEKEDAYDWLSEHGEGA